jgi:hypothetical protein
MCRSNVYEIRVGDVLDEKWASYFVPLEISPGADGTVLTGPVQDQAELFGILLKISNLGLRLVSVNPLPAPPTTATE